MDGVQVILPAELLAAAGVNPADASFGATMLLALELYRENKISLGRAAELSRTSVEAFMVFAGQHEVSLNYSLSDLEEDRRTIERLSS
jgi:Uncharacterised protein family (UPF0175)